MSYLSHPILQAGCTALLTTLALAQGTTRFAPVDPAAAAPELARGVTVGQSFEISTAQATLEERDGLLLGVGANYKSFVADGSFEFIPSLGADAPANMPLRLTLESIRRGETLVHEARPDAPVGFRGLEASIDRDGIVERYEIRIEGVEQSFVFAEKPVGQGDLVVRLRVETPLSAAPGAGLDELRLDSGGFGELVIGAVVGIDAKGAEQAGHMNYTGEHLELVLPGEFVDKAAYPLVLDPPMTFGSGISSGSGDALEPDVAYIAGADNYLVVWHTPYSSTDYDIWGQLVDSCGHLVGSRIQIDYASADDRTPSVAMVAARNRFVVAYARGASGSRNILARTVDPQSGAVGPAGAIAVTSTDQFDPAVGGEVDPLATEAMIVWSDSTAGIFWAECEVRADGSIAPIRLYVVRNRSAARRPTICRSGGASRRYLVAWEERDGDRLGVRFMDANSNPLSAVTVHATPGRSNHNPLLPSVDGDGTEFVLSHSEQEVAGSNAFFDVIFSRFVVPSRPDLPAALLAVNYIENSSSDDDFMSSITSINGRSVVAIEDGIGGAGTGYEMWISGRSRNGVLNGSWYEIGDQFSTASNRHPAIASRQSGGTSFDDALTVHDSRRGSGAASIVGALFAETAVSGQVITRHSGCGGVRIRNSGVPTIGSRIGWDLTGVTGTGFMWVGFGYRLQTICAGGCSMGAFQDVSFVGTSIAPVTIPRDPCLIGGSLFVQGADVGGVGGCNLGTNIAFSETLEIVIGG